MTNSSASRTVSLEFSKGNYHAALAPLLLMTGYMNDGEEIKTAGNPIPVPGTDQITMIFTLKKEVTTADQSVTKH